MNYYLSVLKKYAVFNGRARRKEYWMFTLFSVIISIIFSIIDKSLNLYISQNMGILSSIYSLAVFLPSLGVGVRRLHDTNRSGWWLLIGLIPVIGAIVLIVFFCQYSSPGENSYGTNPKTI